jgi:hypothetical protein
VPPAAFSVPDYLADPGPAAPGDPLNRARSPHNNRFVNPYRSNRGPDLTLADILARPGRRDLDWDRNTGWPASLGWSYIARAARGPSPRHARGGGWQVPGPALVWTGLGMLATAVIMLVAELLR